MTNEKEEDLVNYNACLLVSIKNLQFQNIEMDLAQTKKSF